MKPCTVVATFTPKESEFQAVKSFLVNAATEVLLEDGCLHYELYEEVNGKLLFLEAWRDKKAWEVHNAAPSVAKIVAFLDGKLIEPALVQEMYRVEN